MKSAEVPNPVVRRISLYLRQLEEFSARGMEKVSSRELAESLQLSDAQVRKDLGYFGHFGQTGVGYQVSDLVDELKRILGTDRMHEVVVVGAGDLGRALLRYKGFVPKGFELAAAFDVAAGKVGKKVGSVPVYHMDKLKDVTAEHNAKLAVVTVPAEAAQEVTDALCEAGIKGILNFAPTTIQTPAETAVYQVDLAAGLEQLSFRLKDKN